MKNTNKKHKHRLALTVLFSAVIFLFLFATSLTVGSIILYMIRNDLFFPSGTIPRVEKVILNMIFWSVVLGSLLSVLLGKISLRPVNAVIDAMNSLAHGDFKTRLHFPGKLRHHPTAVEVTGSFNHMAEELEKTEMLRSDFINNFSHEFKTPIVSISGFADLLLEENLNEEEQREYIRIIAEESHRLSNMATNVLNLTKIENQTILTSVTQFNLSEQIRSCLLLFESKWSEKNLVLDVDFSEYEYSGNREMLRQVWINLIDNAVKFANEDGTLRISMTETSGEMIVAISNTGKEIPQESIEHIFNKFYQADESHATQGNGVGLAIVKAIVELHDGKVLVSSGGGKTVFTVVLPK